MCQRIETSLKVTEVVVNDMSNIPHLNYLAQESRSYVTIIVIYYISISRFIESQSASKTNKQYIMTGQPIEAMSLKSLSSEDGEGQFMA